MFASIAGAASPALERTWLKLSDLFRNPSLSGPVSSERLARSMKAYSRRLIPSASSATPRNERRPGGSGPKLLLQSDGGERRLARLSIE